MDFQEKGWGHGLNRSVSGRNKVRVLLNKVIYLVFPQNTENFSTSGGAVSFQEGLFYMVLVS